MKFPLKCASLRAAVDDFNRSLDIDLAELDGITADAVRSGQAQKFEVSMELMWKTLKSYLLEVHGIDVSSPKSVVRKAFGADFLNENETEKLLIGLDLRNRLSHIYKKDMFLAIHEQIVDFADLEEIVLRLESSLGHANP